MGAAMKSMSADDTGAEGKATPRNIAMTGAAGLSSSDIGTEICSLLRMHLQVALTKFRYGKGDFSVKSIFPLRRWLYQVAAQ